MNEPENKTEPEKRHLLSKKAFKTKIYEICQEAMECLYRIKLAELNGQTQWVDDWNLKMDRLLGPDVRAILRKERKGRWDEMRAVVEVFEEAKLEERRILEEACAYVKDVYQLPEPNLAVLREEAQNVFARLQYTQHAFAWGTFQPEVGESAPGEP